MTRQVNYAVYEHEIQYVEKHKVAACALDQLKKKDHLVSKELHKIVVGCLDEKISQKSFQRHIKGMIMQGLVQEIFTNDKKFEIILSPIGEDVHRIIRKTDSHLVTSH